MKAGSMRNLLEKRGVKCKQEDWLKVVRIIRSYSGGEPESDSTGEDEGGLVKGGVKDGQVSGSDIGVNKAGVKVKGME